MFTRTLNRKEESSFRTIVKPLLTFGLTPDAARHDLSVLTTFVRFPDTWLWGLRRPFLPWRAAYSAAVQFPVANRIPAGKWPLTRPTPSPRSLSQSGAGSVIYITSARLAVAADPDDRVEYIAAREIDERATDFLPPHARKRQSIEKHQIVTRCEAFKSEGSISCGEPLSGRCSPQKEYGGAGDRRFFSPIAENYSALVNAIPRR